MEDTVAEQPMLEERTLELKRVSKKTKGGNKMAFTALVAVGDKGGLLGIGHAKAKDARSAIEKASRIAKKSLAAIPLVNGTIPHGMVIKEGAVKLLIKPAPHGTGVISGGAIRVLAELAGVENISIKMVGSRNTLSSVYATMRAFREMRFIRTASGE